MVHIFIKMYMLFKKGIIKYISALLEKIVVKLPKLIITEFTNNI